MIEVAEVQADGHRESTLIPNREMFSDVFHGAQLEIMDRGGFHWFTIPSGGRLEIAAFEPVQ